LALSVEGEYIIGTWRICEVNAVPEKPASGGYHESTAGRYSHLTPIPISTAGCRERGSGDGGGDGMLQAGADVIDIGRIRPAAGANAIDVGGRMGAAGARAAGG